MPELPLQALLLKTLGLTLGLASECIMAADLAANVVTKLAREGEIDCRPAWTHFCQNIHVGCAGRTTIETFSFKLRARHDRAGIESASAGAEIEAAYRRGIIEWGEADSSAILRPHGRMGYISVLADGRYSFRHYVNSEAMMSHGRCD